ncbi:MAG: peptidoglycan DD-metalloendopeptidase family protein, partial [Desulfobacteraceae bacterium]
MILRKPFLMALLLSGLLFLLSTGFVGRASCKTGTIEKKTGVVLDEGAAQKKDSGLTLIKKTVKKGETASTLLNDYLSLKTIYAISRKSCEVFPLGKINRGQTYTITLERDVLVKFEYEIDSEDKLVVKREGDDFSITRSSIPYTFRVELVSGRISSNLFSAVKSAGESCEMALALTDIFAWDIDFIRDIQPGDHFKVLVKKRYRNKKEAGYEKILAAVFTTSGRVNKAFLYKDRSGRTGYYDENGNSLHKKFLKAPLSFSRISSRYSKSRFHPIFKTYRPHRGVDYAAPRGTPIKTVGDGVITGMGYSKSMGNYINIRHPNGFETCYNHMYRFAKTMKKGKEVCQGDVIGYVGSTGYSTGPHLDFRMKKNRCSIDPLKYTSPPANPIDKAEMDRFRSAISRFSQKIITA